MFWPRAIQQSLCVGWDRHSSYTYLTVFCSLRICPLWSSEADRSKWNLILWSLSNASWSKKKNINKNKHGKEYSKIMFLYFCIHDVNTWNSCIWGLNGTRSLTSARLMLNHGWESLGTARAWAQHVERCCANALDFVVLHMDDRETKEMLSRIERKVWPVSILTQQDSTPLIRVLKCTQFVELNMLRAACTVDKSSAFARCLTWKFVFFSKIQVHIKGVKKNPISPKMSTSRLQEVTMWITIESGLRILAIPSFSALCTAQHCAQCRWAGHTEPEKTKDQPTS